ncbi:hypothetical protein [Paraburkholderia dinghuensis]|uniref:Uncharacterized protein n=1 Tax=Paraburkholderia dinghuensis TaxID=2305225 RepID=A0A3N6MLN5_9BURK|nr:hypothetical protein [Paraburkholderia dinghuensis]RQH04724.1 hypothetical protein D1Y85_17715 [Paraburkholderia dinghuensis]
MTIQLRHQGIAIMSIEWARLLQINTVPSLFVNRFLWVYLVVQITSIADGSSRKIQCVMPSIFRTEALITRAAV